MISQGVFTEWFDINFEGETQDEKDFKQNVVELWTAINDQAKAVVAKYTWMEQGGEKKMDKIFTKQLWEHIRFSVFGE